MIEDNLDIVNLKVTNICYENKDCRLIMIQNLTNYAKSQMCDQSKKLQEVITATVSKKMRKPINGILTMIESLIMIEIDPEK